MRRRVDLTTPRGLWEWARLWRLYLQAFPAAERKSLRRILQQRRLGREKVFVIRRNGKFAGLLMTMESPDLVQLDYLAVAKKERNSGLGTEALMLFRQMLAGRPLLAEIESPFEPEADQALRRRRRDFYLRAGMEPLHILAEVYGVRMELLGWDCAVSFDDYVAFYRDYYRPQAAERIRALPYPKI